MIEVADVTVMFDDVTAIRDVDLAVDDGEFVTIIGPSGCGKTTLLRVIGGLQEPTRGRVRIDGRDPEVAQSDADVGFVFQQHTLFPWKTALENVTFLRAMAGRDRATATARELLGAVGLEGFEDARPAALSGGMKQRVAIARALHLGADVLLMDEPFGELDEITRDRMSLELRRIWRRDRKTVLFVTHSVPEAVLLADRCVLIGGEPGRVTETFAIDLPRPRNESVFESPAFHDQITRVRAALHGRHRSPESPARRPDGGTIQGRDP